MMTPRAILAGLLQNKLSPGDFAALHAAIEAVPYLSQWLNVPTDEHAALLEYRAHQQKLWALATDRPGPQASTQTEN